MDILTEVAEIRYSLGVCLRVNSTFSSITGVSCGFAVGF